MTYAGDVTSSVAYARLATDPAAVIVDVRTHAEWSYVGLPDLAATGKQLHTISWSTYPDGRRNDTFVDELHGAGITAEQTILFLCRSGARSKSAAIAATASGLTAFNISDGFEGPLDDHGRRNTIGGWRATGLPWRQT